MHPETGEVVFSTESKAKPVRRRCSAADEPCEAQPALLDIIRSDYEVLSATSGPAQAAAAGQGSVDSSGEFLRGPTVGYNFSVARLRMYLRGRGGGGGGVDAPIDSEPEIEVDNAPKCVHPALKSDFARGLWAVDGGGSAAGSAASASAAAPRVLWRSELGASPVEVFFHSRNEVAGLQKVQPARCHSVQVGMSC